MSQAAMAAGVGSIPRDPSSKEYAEFRDRAAYVYVTGSFPTHLRTYFTSLLRMVTAYNKEPTSLDHRMGNMRMEGKFVKELHLDEHPMVRKVKDLMAKGFIINKSWDLTERRPYGKVPLVNTKTGEKIIVQIDGSVKDA